MRLFLHESNKNCDQFLITFVGLFLINTIFVHQFLICLEYCEGITFPLGQFYIIAVWWLHGHGKSSLLRQVYFFITAKGWYTIMNKM